MKKMTLKNDFHNTIISVLVPDNIAAGGAADTWFYLQTQVHGVAHPIEAAKARLRRIKRVLCGRTGCTCGGVR